MVIRPANRADVLEMTGETYPETMRAIVVEDDGQLLAIAGVRHGIPHTCFSNLRPEMKNHPRVIVRAMRKMREMLNGYARDVYAIADKDEPTASEFLKHVGFKFIGDGSQGEMYLWQSQQ